MKIRKVRQITYITILSGEAEYVGKSFEAVIENEIITGFKDWLNGNVTNGFIKSVSGFTFTRQQGFDIEIYENAIANNNADTVKNRLYQRLLLQYNELKYSYVKTEGVGIPYLNKKTKAEMDLILRNEIISTEGVDKIIEFNSTVVNRVYHLEFKVTTVKGEIVWLTIDQ